MTKNQRILVYIFIIILLGSLIFYFVFKSRSSPLPTEAEVTQDLIDSTTAPETSNPMNPKDLQQIIDSTTAPEPKNN